MEIYVNQDLMLVIKRSRSRPGKEYICQLSIGDTVYLYQNGVGIITVGTVSGDLKKVNTMVLLIINMLNLSVILRLVLKQFQPVSSKNSLEVALISGEPWLS